MSDHELLVLAGTIVVLVLNISLVWFLQIRPMLLRIESSLEKMTNVLLSTSNLTRDLYEMHNVRGENGSYVWYERGSDLKRLIQISENQTEILRNIERSVARRD